MIVEEKWIKDSQKEYMEKLMNEEKECDHRISAGVKEGPADCIRINEVAAALKKIKRHKSPDITGLIAEMILDICNGIVKEGSIWEDWKSSVVFPIYKWKGIQWSVDLTEELNCWNML